MSADWPTQSRAAVRRPRGRTGALRCLLPLGTIGLLLGCAPQSAPPPTPLSTPVSTPSPVPSAEPPAFEIAWGGDVLLGDAATPALQENGYVWPFERIAGLLDADYLVANAEGPITTLTNSFFPDQEFSYNADPAAASALADVGFNAMSLSNNHALDRGPDGLRQTIDTLTSAGVTPFGAGSEEEAIRPHIVDTPAGSLAIIALGERWNYGAEASATDIGTVSITPASVARAHELATEAGARWTVAFVHWGENYSGVTRAQREAARMFADAGYDLVIGHHAHVVQEVDLLDGMPVLYSLGNLAFGTPGRFDGGEGYGLVARTGLMDDGGLAIRLHCIVTDNDLVGFQPEPCTAAEAQRLFTMLGPDVQVIGEEGVVESRR